MSHWPHALLLLVALIVGALAAGPALTTAQPPSPPPGPPVRYRVVGVITREQRSAIAATGAAIDAIGPDAVAITATPDERRRIAALGFAVQPLAGPLDFPPADAAYHTYAELSAELQAVAAAHPDRVRLFSIGRSYEGRELWAAKVSDNVQTDEDEPEALFVGHYHAREHLSVEMLLAILHMLVDGDDPARPKDPINRLVDTREIYLIFDLNPDGGEYDIATGVYQYWRKNRQPNSDGVSIGTDLNRNHSYRWGGSGASDDPGSETYRGPAPASAPEVAAIESFVNNRVIDGVQQIRVAITFHTYGELILWPYGYTYDDVPDDMQADDHAVFVALGQAMAATNGYTPQQASDLYLTSGDFTDWAYGVHRIFAYTFEMGTNFYPPGAAIPAETARNRAAVLALLDYAGCPYATIGKAVIYCAEGSAPQRIWLPFLGGS
jgi:hypothetical protein